MDLVFFSFNSLDLDLDHSVRSIAPYIRYNEWEELREKKLCICHIIAMEQFYSVIIRLYLDVNMVFIASTASTA